MERLGELILKAIIFILIVFFSFLGAKIFFFDRIENNALKIDLQQSRDSLIKLDSVFKIQQAKIEKLEIEIYYKDSVIENRSEQIKVIYKYYEKKIDTVKSFNAIQTIDLLSRNLSQSDNIR